VPKLKTHKATAKRFKLTGSGKLVRTKGEKRHLRRKRSKRAKRASWKMIEVETNGEVKRVKRLMPYAKKYKG
jgi:large subunit ribosomal protein L35